LWNSRNRAAFREVDEHVGFVVGTVLDLDHCEGALFVGSLARNATELAVFGGQCWQRFAIAQRFDLSAREITVPLNCSFHSREKSGEFADELGLSPYIFARFCNCSIWAKNSPFRTVKSRAIYDEAELDNGLADVRELPLRFSPHATVFARSNCHCPSKFRGCRR